MAFLVRDYDEALAFFVDQLGFRVVADTPLGPDKRWVLVAPPGTSDGAGGAAGGATLLLARAVGAAQTAAVGRQGGGRVFLFLHTDDFARDHAALRARGVVFTESPREEPYGTVAVFVDLYGNPWDLVQPRAVEAPAVEARAVEAPAADATLAARYDALWTDAAPTVAAGAVVLDPWLAGTADGGGAVPIADDPRRGLTLLARPAPAVADALAAFLDQLRTLEPGQYYQPADALHHTVLSLVSAAPDYRPSPDTLPAYQAAIVEAVADVPAFAVAVRGVTLSTGAVLGQGFPQGDTLDRLRDRLRAALTARGLGGTMDLRYRLETAHLTLVRFAAPLRDPARFVDALDRARDVAFGTSVIDTLHLVSGDWYHSAGRERRLARYPLRPS